MAAVMERVVSVTERTDGPEDAKEDDGTERRPLSYFNRWLKTTRDAHGLTQTQLGKLVGIEQSEISKWENGKLRNPPPEKAAKFAAAFGMSYEEVWEVVGGRWPNAEWLPAVVKDERNEVIPEFVRLLNLRLSPQEAVLLSEMIRVHRRWEEEAYGTERQEPEVEDTP
jgi:transcriptional regulator with XRE-family HTH domain